MKDYSFIRLKDNFTDAKLIGDSPTTTHPFYSFIQLLPNKTYLQITNFSGGISLDSDCEVFIVDCNDNVLADVTDNVFIEEFTDSNGNNQCSIEYVNLGVDFYGNTVFLKFDMLSSDAVYYSNPINITAYNEKRTVFFKYKNYDDFSGIGYTNANKWQSISLQMYYDIPIDESETEDYFQISKELTISARSQRKLFDRYKIEKINRFGFERLNTLLKHNLVYLDDVRVTNKPTVSSDDRQGDSNWFETDLTVSLNNGDTSFSEFQIFQGLNITDFSPEGNYSTGFTINELRAQFNIPITLNTGQVRVYNDDGTLIDTFTESDMSIVLQNQLVINTVGSSVENLANDGYYVHVSVGLVSGLGVLNNGITDNETWVFNILSPEYESTEYENTQYLT